MLRNPLEALGDDLAGQDALAVLAIAASPFAGWAVSTSPLVTVRPAGTSPITRTSGRSRVVLARYARNTRLADALHQQAFVALTASPGARAFYDHHRGRGATHHQALRALSNRLLEILDGCLHHRTSYDESTAWAYRQPAAA